jgi:cytochrome c
LPDLRQPGYCYAAAPHHFRPAHGFLDLRLYWICAWSDVAMDSFELNKILGAVLGTCLGVMSLNLAAGAVFAPAKMAKPGYEIVVPEAAAPGAGPAEAAPPEKPLAELLASASIQKGENSAKKCAACHTFAKDGKNGVGPDLWAVVGRARAHAPNFNYSAAMKAAGGNWTLEELNHFITNPKAAVPGTAMTFAGLPRATERADLLAYLNSLSDNPAPLPTAAQAGETRPAQ